jgi:hypothetical protein
MCSNILHPTLSPKIKEFWYCSHLQQLPQRLPQNPERPPRPPISMSISLSPITPSQRSRDFLSLVFLRSSSPTVLSLARLPPLRHHSIQRRCSLFFLPPHLRPSSVYCALSSCVFVACRHRIEPVYRREVDADDTVAKLRRPSPTRGGSSSGPEPPPPGMHAPALPFPP